MNLSRLWAMAWKEFLHLLRDWRSLWMGIMTPLTMLFMFSYALSLDVDHVPFVLWDQSQSQLSREFVSRFTGSRYFSLRGTFAQYADMERAIDTREAMMGLVIPSDFARRIASDREVNVQVIFDGSDSTTASISLGYATAIGGAFSQSVVNQVTHRKGIKLNIGSVDLRPTVWFNEDLESKNYIIPGLIAIIMMVIAALLTSLTVAREWENGTMEQLISSPLKGPEIIIGKLIPYFALGMFDMLICIVSGIYVFHVPFRGSIFLLIVLAAIFLIGTLGMGIYISSSSKKQLAANELAVLTTYLPAFMLSGFVYTISNMPKPIQFLTYFVPARYFVKILRGIYLKGLGLETLGIESLLLVFFATFMIVVAIISFKKKIT